MERLPCPGQEIALLPGSPPWCVSQATHTLWKKSILVLRGLYLHSARGPLTLFSHEWCPLELCEGSALAAQLLYFSRCFFLEVLRGRTVTSALGMFPALLRFKARICSRVFHFWFLSVLTDTWGGDR